LVEGLDVLLGDQILCGVTADADRLSHDLNSLRLGLSHAQPRFGLAFGSQNHRLLVAFGVHDLRLLLTFRAQNRGSLLALGCRHDRAARPFGGHLLFHRETNFLWRGDVLELDTHHLDAPLLGCRVQSRSELTVDRVARCQGVIEIERADHVSERRQRELLDAPAKVLHFVDGTDRIHYDEINNRVDFHRHVVARDHGLRFDFRDLLAQVDGFTDRVEERDDDVEAGFGGAVIFAEPLDELHLLLRHDLDRLEQHDQQGEGDREQHEYRERHAGLTSRTMPSARTTLTRVPAASGVAARAAQSCPSTLTRPEPSVDSMSSVTTPSRPISVSLRDGTPGETRPISRGRSTPKPTLTAMMNATICSGRPKPRNAAIADAIAPTLTKIKPKCGIDTSTIAAIR